MIAQQVGHSDAPPGSHQGDADGWVVRTELQAAQVCAFRVLGLPRAVCWGCPRRSNDPPPSPWTAQSALTTHKVELALARRHLLEAEAGRCAAQETAAVAQRSGVGVNRSMAGLECAPHATTPSVATPTLDRCLPVEGCGRRCPGVFTGHRQRASRIAQGGAPRGGARTAKRRCCSVGRFCLGSRES